MWNIFRCKDSGWSWSPRPAAFTLALLFFLVLISILTVPEGLLSMLPACYFDVYVFMLEHPRRVSIPRSHSMLSAPFTVWVECSWQRWSDSLWCCDALAPPSVQLLRFALLNTSAKQSAVHLLLYNTWRFTQPLHTHGTKDQHKHTQQPHDFN